MYKKALCIIVTLSLLFCYSNNTRMVYADNLYQFTDSTESAIAELLLEYSLAYNAVDCTKKIAHSQSYPVYGDLTDTFVSFLMEDNLPIAMLLYTKSDSQDSSCFFPLSSPNLDFCFANKTPIAIVATETTIQVVTPDTQFTLYGNCTDINIFKNPVRLAAITAYEYEKIIPTRAGDDAPDISSGTFLPVPIVPNAKSPDINLGLCWLASSASVIRYRKSTNYPTTIDAYNNLKANYNPNNGYGFPYGDPDGLWIKRALALYGVSYATLPSTAKLSNIKNCILNNRPVICGLSQNGNPAHTVVICGYTTYSGNYYYYIADSLYPSSYGVVKVNPNVSGFNYIWPMVADGLYIY